jgi:hypothetical protein
MPIFLDTRGLGNVAIAICARCSCKYSYTSLKPDPNFPGLRCCPDGCLDQIDPWRLAPRPTENITLEFARPDVDISGYGATPIYAPPPSSPSYFSNDGGVLVFAKASYAVGYPTSFIGPPGGVYNNGLTVGIYPGVTPNPSAPPVYFGQITPAQLLALGGGNLPLGVNGAPPGTVPVGSKQLFNNGDEVNIA